MDSSKIIHFILGISFCFQAYAQTPGSIVKYPTSSGRIVLDPDFNGYSSTSSSGFVSNDETESEIPYIEIPGLVSEPISDPLAGPN